MIQMRTWLTVADNSGARKLTCIMPVGGDAEKLHRKARSKRGAW